MVFSQLSSHEKDAFFGLLDEYFASRPDLLTNIAKSQAVNSAANSVQDAFKNPATRNAAIGTVKSGLNSARTNWNAKQESSPEPTDEAVSSRAGRVAAAAESLMSHPRFGGPPTSTSTGPPKPPPRKVSTNSTADDSNSPPPPTDKPLVQRSLSSTRTFGSDVDLSSAKGFFTSVRNPPKNSKQPLTNPSSFLPPSSSGTGSHKKQFAPPPVRRVISDSSPTSTTSISAPPPPPPPRKKEEPAGELADVLYDFTGSEPGDLDVKESQRVEVVERSSEDWWKVKLDGREGLVPASYLKILTI